MSMFYDKYGELVGSVKKKSGVGEKSPTVADARELGLLPRYSSVAQYKNSYFLTEWRIEQAIKKTCEIGGLSLDLLDSIKGELKDEGKTVMGIGTDIHEAIELTLLKKPNGSFSEIVSEVEKFVGENFDDYQTERKVITDWFGGRCDFVGFKDKVGTVIDFKTVMKFDGKTVSDSYILQLGAYTFGLRQLGFDIQHGGIFIIEQAEPHRVKYMPVKPRDIEKAIDEFIAILLAWRISNGFTDNFSLLEILTERLKKEYKNKS